MAYIPKGNSAWLLRKAINRSDSAIADLETNLTTLARTASNTGTSTTTQVLFNDAGIVNGDAGLVYNKTTDALSVGGALGVTGAATLSSTLAVTGTSTLTGAVTIEGLKAGKGTGAASTNTVFGTTGLSVRTAANDCSIFGSTAGAAITTGGTNTLVGSGAGSSLADGSANTIMGSSCLAACVSGIYNTASGQATLSSATGSENTAYGARSLINLVGGTQNTGCGKSAGESQTSGSNNAFFGYNASADSFTGSNQYNYGDGAVATHKFRAGDVVVGTGNVVVASAKGIDFSATADSSGTMTSELLNDYEEGTWVPTDISGAGLVFTVSNCKYTKIGRAVTIQGVITYPSTVNTTASKFGGLPFAFVGIAPFSICSSNNAADVAYLYAVSGGPQFENSAGYSTTNVMLSGKQVYFFGTYMI